MDNLDWTLDSNGLLIMNGCCVEDEPDDNEDSMRMLKVSDDKRYAVVYNIAQFYADFYCFDEIEKEPRYLYTKKRNAYRNEKFFIEFFKNPTNTEESLLMFNTRHGELTIYYADSGNEKSTDCQDDKFITSIKIIDDKYMYMTCWYWQPIFCTYLYNINEMLTSCDYNGVMIDSDFDVPNKLEHFKLNDDNMIEIFDKGDKWHQVYSLLEFDKNHTTYKSQVSSINISKQIKDNKSNILHKIFNGVDNQHVSYKCLAREKLDTILNTDDDCLIESQCIGNNSKMDLSYHVNSIIKANVYSDEFLNYLVPKTLFHGFTSNLKGLKEINLKFTFKRHDVELEMLVKQIMKKVDDNDVCQMFEIDPNEPCYIELS